MGLTAERVANHYKISRADQDAFALASHQKAFAAQAAGRFDGELVPVTVARAVPGANSRQARSDGEGLFRDEGPRADSTLEALGKLKPAFHTQGTVTAGNASQTSDGAAAVVLMDAARARELGIRPIARLVAYAATGCLPEEMGMGPVTAIRKALRRTSLTLPRSASSSSTRPSPPKPWPSFANSSRPGAHQRSTEAPSPSATRSAAPAPS